MSKLNMKKVQIIALKKDRKRLLEHLQDSALIEINVSDKPASGFDRPDMSSQTDIFEKNARLTESALAVLNSLSPVKKGLLDSFSGRRCIDPDDIGQFAANSKECIKICSRITELNRKLAENAAESVRIRTTLMQLEPWNKLDIPFSLTKTEKTDIFIGALPALYTEQSLAEALAAENPKLKFAFEILSSSPEQTCITLAALKSQHSEADNALRAFGFSRPFSAGFELASEQTKILISRQAQLEKATQEYKEEIISYADKRHELENIQDYFRIRADKYAVISALDHSKYTFVITGYVPEIDSDKLEAMCKRVAVCDIEFSNAGDEAPVKLKNNKFAAPAQSIVTMYSTPARSDIDPTPILAFFYYFFFGMMFSDSGYGLLMVLATGLIIKKYKPEEKMRLNLKLFQYCGISTFLWGLVFGSFFGDAPASLYNYFTGDSITMADIIPWPILDPQKDALVLMIVSIGFGLIHILVGMCCKFYICWKNKDYKAALFDTGFWMLILIGFAVLAAGMATTKLVLNIGIGIAAFGAVGLILTQGRNKKGVVGKVFGGIASLYDITGYISDLLSYSRLLALGLTTGVMAQVFNMLSTMFGRSIPGFIPLIIIFVLGHLINIGLNALGSYVHTMRLQYVEMFSKFYEGGGKEFSPFKLNSKYVRIQEENKK